MLLENVAAVEEIFHEIFRDFTEIFYYFLRVWRDVCLCPHQLVILRPEEIYRTTFALTSRDGIE
jgi:hypothetical protein